VWAVIGYLVVSLASVATMLIVAWERPASRPPSWDLGDVARKQVIISSGLAGFAITGLVLLLTLTRSEPGGLSEPFAAVVVMFVVAYMSYVSAALMYSNLVRSNDSLPADPQAVQYSLAAPQFYRSVFLGWIAMSPMLDAYGLVELSDLVDRILLVAVLGGWLLMSSTLYRLGYVRGRAVAMGPVIAFAFTLAYALIVAFAAPQLRSPTSLLDLTVVLFAVNILSFGLFAMVPGALQHRRLGPLVARYWHLASITNGMASAILLGFLWMAAAGLV
jgi:hypothetical protein